MRPAFRYKILRINELSLQDFFFLLTFFLFISIDGLGQCVNPAVVTLSSTSGSTCSSTPVTISGNTFGGSATSVTITENGAGTVSPLTAGATPFVFTYTPSAGDAGNTVTVTVTTNNPAGSPCAAAIATYLLTAGTNAASPVVGAVAQPVCSVGTGSVVLNGLPVTGTWRLTRYPGTITSDVTGTSKTITGLAVGIYNFTVTNSTGCVSGLSANVVITQPTGTPSAPLLGTITQPGSELQTGSVVLNGLPEIGIWTLILTPGNINTSGTGISKTVSGLAAGTYIFTVTNAAGCISGPSASAIITAPAGSVQAVITNPLPVCFPSSADLTAPEVTSGSAPDLTYTYWSDAAAKIPYITPLTATAGSYYIKCTSPTGLFTVKPVVVTLYRRPLANAGADQVLEYLFRTKMNTQLGHEYETGLWSVISGTGVFSDASNAKTTVAGLSVKENKFLWTVTNRTCPSSQDTVIITVHDLVISALITPNMDGRNDYFVLQDTGMLVKTAVEIFNRSGVQVYKNENYDNLWDGVDYKGNPLPDDTYFCIIKTGDRKIVSGFIVVRR